MGNRNILAQHKEQEGWVYVRVQATPAKSGTAEYVGGVGSTRDNPYAGQWVLGPYKLIRAVIRHHREWVWYDDRREDGSRIISSRRVEEAVETWDYLQRCAEEGLVVYHGRDAIERGWAVGDSVGPWSTGGTLREAYHRAASRRRPCE